MIRIEPKPFQTAALQALRKFLADARLRDDAAVPFQRATNKLYRPLEGMPEVPSVCLRLPTGGGKTILGAMSIGVAADTYLEREFPLVLWLVPSDAIRRQTLRALQNVDHPYRAVLADRFGSAVRVMEMADFPMLTPQDVATRCCILVGTMQSLQVNNTDGRKVYAHNENLEGFFSSSTVRGTPGLEQYEGAGGGPRFSFANLLKVQRPLVVLDEAHKFMTPLALQVRERIGAAAIVELTATPDRDANVLYHATAGQLKDAGMIKLPVMLTEHLAGWQQAVSAAVRERRHLEEMARNEPRYIRPLLLIQAQNVNEQANWQAIREHLVATDELREDEIAVATGEVNELRDTDLFSPNSRITTILTVQALAEGWDCSFAYVLCSVANLGSARAVEQMIGRVLRMPGAVPCVQPELNRAYVHASSRAFGETAKTLRDGLVKSGFDQSEAQTAIENTQRLPLLEERPVLRLTLSSPPDLTALSAGERDAVHIETTTHGQAEVVLTGAVPVPLRSQMLKLVPEPRRAETERRIDEHNRRFEPSPQARGVNFAVPTLKILVEGELLPFDAGTLEEHTEMDLLANPADVSALRFDDTTRTYSFDLFGEVLTMRWVSPVEARPSLLEREVSQVGLVRWLTDRLRDMRVTDAVLSAWVDGATAGLLARPGIDMAVLDRGRYLLLRLLEQQKRVAYEAERTKAFQRLLFDRNAAPVTTNEFAFRFPAEYPATRYCERTVFVKHYYDRPGELEESGEEYECALEIDRWPETEVWVRNLSARERTSFSLQTASDRFYPDFVVKLKNGKTLAVEYKGKVYETNDDSKEKQRIGQLWAERSSDTALFAMIAKRPGGKTIRQQLDDALHGGTSPFLRGTAQAMHR